MAAPKHLKQSAMTAEQHLKCLKVISYLNPFLPNAADFPRPVANDFIVYEEMKRTYSIEQEEFKRWARNVWRSGGYVDALRAASRYDTIYEHRFITRAHMFTNYPKKYKLLKDMPLSNDNVCDMVHVRKLINVPLKYLPQIKWPALVKLPAALMDIRLYKLCYQHPTKFVVPNTSWLTEMSLTETQRNLSYFTLDSGTHIIANESALRCLMQQEDSWQFTVSVFYVSPSYHRGKRIVVLGGDCSTIDDSAMKRIQYGLKHDLNMAMVPPMEKSMMRFKWENKVTFRDSDDSDDDTDDDDDDSEEEIYYVEDSENEDLSEEQLEKKMNRQGIHYPCDIPTYEKTPLRSFKKWHLKNDMNEEFNLIVHCAHRAKDGDREVVIEPVAEYQANMGGAELSEDCRRRLLLQLILRKPASLILVRICVIENKILCIEKITYENFLRMNGHLLPSVYNRIHATCSQLLKLEHGFYVLKHEPTQNGIGTLYVADKASNDLELKFDLGGPDDRAFHPGLSEVPVLGPNLLPVFLDETRLPCAFSPIPEMCLSGTESAEAIAALEAAEVAQAAQAAEAAAARAAEAAAAGATEAVAANTAEAGAAAVDSEATTSIEDARDSEDSSPPAKVVKKSAAKRGEAIVELSDDDDVLFISETVPE